MKTSNGSPSRYQVKDVCTVTLDRQKYSGNAALYVMLQHVNGSRRDAAFLRSIARGEDGA
jgi:hypothetical protein